MNTKPSSQAQACKCKFASFSLCRFCRFIAALERGDKDKNAAEEASIQLTDEQIRETGAQFGTNLQSTKDLLTMRRTMARNTFADWVNALGYLQMLQNTFVKGVFAEQKDGLWKQPIVKR